MSLQVKLKNCKRRWKNFLLKSIEELSSNKNFCPISILCAGESILAKINLKAKLKNSFSLAFFLVEEQAASC